MTPATPPGEAFERFVPGRPTGYSSGAHEQRWKQAVRDAFSGCVLPAGVSVRVRSDFVLGADQVGRVEPDLDNLIKSTIDALAEVIGERPGPGRRVEADDVRVNQIMASKRASEPGEQPGAMIVVSERSTGS